jgi:hypothetical protein
LITRALTNKKFSGENMIRTNLLILFLSVILSESVFAESAPTRNWAKKLPSKCWFITIRGDSIISVGNEITVISGNGTILSQSQQLDDIKNITGNPPLFYYSKDNSIILVKGGCTVKKISLDGKTIWEKSFCDSVQGVIFNGFTEDNDGNLYLCGTVQRKAGLIVKIENSGKYTLKGNYLFACYYSIEWLRDSLFVSTSDSLHPYSPESIGVFDNSGNFIKTIVGTTGYGLPFFVDDNRILFLGQTGGPSLYKSTFFLTSNITLSVFYFDGSSRSLTFDFGKWENSISLQKYGNGFLMITRSDETVNMGTNYFNYFVTKLDSSLNKEWQLRFGTDSTGLSGGQHYRVFASDGSGTILATHNDTLIKYTGVTGIRNVQLLGKQNIISSSNSLFKVYDLQGRLLFKYRSETLPEDKLLKISGMSTGLKLIRSDNYPESKMEIYNLNR